MRNTLCTIFFLVTALQARSQLPVPALFVHDNSVFFSNTETVLDALEESYPIMIYGFFNAVDSMRSPTYNEMKAYRLVIWYTSTDGVDRWLWNGNDSDNEQLSAFMENGGLLWVMGNDFLYDRYGAPPYDFEASEFPYHYLGIQKYVAQSYGDDGGLGVETMNFTENTQISEVPLSLQWIYPTLWWADGCIPVEETSQAFYEMGPESYVLAGLKTALVRYNGEPPFLVSVSLFFDPALMDTHENRVVLFSGIGNFFSKFITYGNPEANECSAIRVFPNPCNENLHIQHTSGAFPKQSTLHIRDAMGQIFLTEALIPDQMHHTLRLKSLPTGLYLLDITRNGERILNTKVMKL